MEIIDALTRICALVLCIRGLCVLNRMSYAHWSLFSFALLGMVASAAWIVFFGVIHDEYGAQFLIIAVTGLCLSDKRRTVARRTRKPDMVENK